jgi:hypothetical protein
MWHVPNLNRKSGSTEMAPFTAQLLNYKLGNLLIYMVGGHGIEPRTSCL